jgi:hypothetical protein
MRPTGERIMTTGLDYVLLQFHMWFSLPLFAAVALHVALLDLEWYAGSHRAFWLVPVWMTAILVRWLGWMGLWVDGDDLVVRNTYRTVRLPLPVRALKRRSLWMSVRGGDCVVLESSVTGRRCKAAGTGGDDWQAVRVLDEAGVLDGSWRENTDRMRGFSGG